MSKQCLDAQQMLHLQELGLDTSNASAEYYRMSKKMDWFLVFGCRSKEELLDTEENIPAYTLQDVLDALPAIIKYAGKMYSLTIDMLNRSIHYCRNTVVLDAVNYFYEIPLIDAAYKLLCWAIKQGYVETNKNE